MSNGKEKQGLNSIHRLILNEKGIYLWLGGLRPNVDINFLDDAIMDNVSFFPMLFVLYYLNSFFLFLYGMLILSLQGASCPRFLKIHISLPSILTCPKTGNHWHVFGWGLFYRNSWQWDCIIALSVANQKFCWKTENAIKITKMNKMEMNCNSPRLYQKQVSDRKYKI